MFSSSIYFPIVLTISFFILLRSFKVGVNDKPTLKASARICHKAGFLAKYSTNMQSDYFFYLRKILVLFHLYLFSFIYKRQTFKGSNDLKSYRVLKNVFASQQHKKAKRKAVMFNDYFFCDSW